ncbi:MerR family transcriptional regulator [Paenibacillus sp. FSL H8-0034]|uniref:MerR family transcriptional regulator n=1 Tax=Paenibacillus sp. FSL H8-0034 TaxID=2954671 RepID=UPI0030F83FF2
MKYTIGQVAKMKHLTISQLHYYDRQGLLPFIERKENSDRIFNDEALKYLDMILCLKDTGMPIKEIKNFISWSMSGEDTIPQRLEMMKQQEVKVLQQIHEIEANLIKIQEKIATYQRDLLSKDN